MDDVAALRARASELEGVARVLRDEADRVRRSLEVDWVSDAAARWRDEGHRLLRDLHAEADRVTATARALREHAEDVRHAQAAARRAFDWFQAQLTTALHTLEAGADAVGDAAVAAAREVVDRARSSPPAGSPDWLRWVGW